MATLVSRITDLAAAIRDKLNVLTKAVQPTVIDKGTLSTGTVTFTASAGSYQRLEVGGALSLAIAGWPASGTYGELAMEIVNGGSAAITYPAAWVFKQSDGTWGASPPHAFQTAGTDILVAFTRDGGATVRVVL